METTIVNVRVFPIIICSPLNRGLLLRFMAGRVVEKTDRLRLLLSSNDSGSIWGAAH